jgi:hypothetical protein
MPFTVAVAGAVEVAMEKDVSNVCVSEKGRLSQSETESTRSPMALSRLLRIRLR